MWFRVQSLNTKNLNMKLNFCVEKRTSNLKVEAEGFSLNIHRTDKHKYHKLII
jgi:hypothetical protein